MDSKQYLDESIDLFLDGYRDTHPEVFKNAKVLAAVKTIVEAAGIQVAGTVRMFTTSAIANNVTEYAKHDVDLFKSQPVTEAEKAAFNKDPDQFMKMVTVSIWNIALDIIEGVGYNRLEVKDILKKAKDIKGEEDFDDIKFTTNQVGKA